MLMHAIMIFFKFSIFNRLKDYVEKLTSDGIRQQVFLFVATTEIVVFAVSVLMVFRYVFHSLPQKTKVFFCENTMTLIFFFNFWKSFGLIYN